LWRDSLGSTIHLAADADGSGAVDQADYALWVSNYGATSVAIATGVPEPATFATIAGFLMTLSRRSRR
jgi:hypothetical protein